MLEHFVSKAEGEEYKQWARKQGEMIQFTI